MTDRFAYLRRSIGTWGALGRAFALLLSPIIKIDRCHIAMVYFKPGSDPSNERRTDDAKGMHSIVAATPEDLEAIRDEMGDRYDFEDARGFMLASPSRFLNAHAQITRRWPVPGYRHAPLRAGRIFHLG